MSNKLLLTSYGLTTGIGRKLIGNVLKTFELSNKRIFLFQEPHYSIEKMLVAACLDLGFKKENIILSGQQKTQQDIINCDIYYCTEGNTFEVLSLLRERGLDSIIREGFKKDNKIYIGCSAGASIAGVSIEEMKYFDRNFVGMIDFTGLALFDGIIIPHYTKEELKSYIDNRPDIEKKYNLILSVSNENCIVLDV